MTWWQRFIPPKRTLKIAGSVPAWSTDYGRSRVVLRAAAVEVISGWHDSLELRVLDRSGGEHVLSTRRAPNFVRAGELGGVVASYRHEREPLPPTVELRFHEHAEVLAERHSARGELTKYLSYNFGTKRRR